MKRLLSIILVIKAVSAFANDGVYFTSGNFLVPMQESSISVRKEILTITIGKGEMAVVDVYYEFYNPDSTKTVAMAFEAAAPYNAIYDISKNISHPYIYDFGVEMNGQKLEYRNTLIVSQWGSDSRDIDRNITPLDLTEWKNDIPDEYYDTPNALYNARLDSVIYADYGYMFEAVFKPGINVVHHIYSYKMSYSIGYKYNIPYRLIPATRWANSQIDDFTLRIKNENDMDYFISNDALFSAAPFSFVGGGGCAYPFVDEYGEHNTLVAGYGEGAVLEWHTKNFAPQFDMNIISIDNYLPSQCKYLNTWASKVVMTPDGGLFRFIGTSGDNYLVEAQDYGLVSKEGARVETFSAENGQGILTIKNREFQSVNIRQQPTTKSDVIGRIKDTRGKLPVVLKCLGVAEERDVNGCLEYYWYKVEVNGKIGYVREDIMTWDAIDTY